MIPVSVKTIDSTVAELVSPLSLPEELQLLGIPGSKKKVIVGVGIANTDYQEIHGAYLHFTYRIGSEEVIFGRCVGDLELRIDPHNGLIFRNPGRTGELLGTEIIGRLARELNRKKVRNYEIVLENPLCYPNDRSSKLVFDFERQVPQTVVERKNGGKIKYLVQGAKSRSQQTGRYFVSNR